MIKVGFILDFSPQAWLGGANYFRSLFGALSRLPYPEVTPIVFVPKRHEKEWGVILGGTPLRCSPLVARWSPAWVVRKALWTLTSRDILLRWLFWRCGITVYSHGGSLGPGAKVLTLGWIPDFQHLHLPEFFSKEECRRRDAVFLRLCQECDVVLVSSEDAKKDLVGFCPTAKVKARVLRFVPHMTETERLLGKDEIELRYGINGPYFYIPNQFWKHKNHELVVDALSILRSRGVPAMVLTTGSSSDPRNPGFFKRLTDRVKQEGLQARFRHLGVVPYVDMLSLMHHSKATINPSNFEGWSTTVEEAKKLGCRLILSDIPVHREQNPPGGIFFNPRSAEELALAMENVLQFQARATSRMGEDDYLQFGYTYQSLITDLLQSISQSQRQKL